MSARENVRRKTIPWWIWLLGVDLFVVTMSALKQYSLVFPGKQKLVRHFNLAVEMNAAVWWSAVSLLVLALLAYELYCRKRQGRLAWLSLSVVFASLSLDEIGSIHERVGSWGKLLPFGIVFVSLAAHALTVLFRNRSTRRSALLIGAGICVFGTVALQEYLEHRVSWSTMGTGLRIAVEEGSELLGMFLIFCGIVPQRSRSIPSSLGPLLPDPARMNKLPEIILAGWFVQTLASMTVPGFIDLGEKGNPLIWYPAAVFFILFAASLRVPNAAAAKSKMLPVLSVFFLLCSVGLAYDPPRLLPLIGTLVSRENLPGTFFLSMAGLLLLIGAAIPGFWSGNGRYLPLLFLLPPLLFLDTRLEIEFVIAGIMALLVFNVYGRYERNAGERKPVPETFFARGISAAPVTSASAEATASLNKDRPDPIGDRN